MENRKLIGIDTESHGNAPWSIQASIKPGTGIMILYENKDAVEEFAECINDLLDSGYELVFHFAQADLPIMDLTGIRYEGRYRDTMQEIYGFGSHYSQGLKAAAYRLLGRKRRSWEEVVGRVSKQRVVQWMWDAHEIAQNELCTVNEGAVTKRRVSKPIFKKSTIEKALCRIMQHTSPDTDYDPWEKWSEVDRMHEPYIVERIGPMPLKGIANCDLDVAVRYGCEDADNTLELALLLEQERVRVVAGWGVADDDVDR